MLGLGPNLFYNSPMEACIVVCRMKKPPERAGKVLFIDALDQVTSESAQSFLSGANVERIVSAYVSWRSQPGLARVVGVEEVLSNRASLNLALYVAARVDGAPRAAAPELIVEWSGRTAGLKLAAADALAVLGPASS